MINMSYRMYHARYCAPYHLFHVVWGCLLSGKSKKQDSAEVRCRYAAYMTEIDVLKNSNRLKGKRMIYNKPPSRHSRTDRIERRNFKSSRAKFRRCEILHNLLAYRRFSLWHVAVSEFFPTERGNFQPARAQRSVPLSRNR